MAELRFKLHFYPRSLNRYGGLVAGAPYPFFEMEQLAFSPLYMVCLKACLETLLMFGLGVNPCTW